MRPHVGSPALGFVLALAWMLPAPAVWASGEGGERVAQVGPSGLAGPAPDAAAPAAPTEGERREAVPGPGPDEPDALSQEPPFADRVASFVSEFYLSGSSRTDEELAVLYAPYVDYFENRRWSRDRVLRDKRAYFANWPKREYRLIRETLKAKWRGPGKRILDVAFDYDFAVASSKRTSRGRGRAALTLDLSTDGGRITREQGAVLKRW